MGLTSTIYNHQKQTLLERMKKVKVQMTEHWKVSPKNSDADVLQEKGSDT